jgi:antitoxin ParD1/3/4
MPTRNVNLTPELDRFISAKVDTGLYANASEVIRAALRLLEQNERENEIKIAALRAAVEKGIASGVSEPGVLARVRERHNPPKAEAPRLLSESLRILKERGSMVTLDSEFGRDLEEIIRSHHGAMNPPAWD